MKVLKFSRKCNRLCYWKQYVKNYKFSGMQSKVLLIAFLYFICYLAAFFLHLILK